MGKYMKKSRTAEEIAIMETVAQTGLGVKTRGRSRTPALQSENKSSSPPSPSLTPAGEEGDGSYLQLRSRSLDKPLEKTSKRLKKAVEETCAAPNPNPNNNLEPSLNSNSNSNLNFHSGSMVPNPASCSVSAGIKEITDGDTAEKAIDGEKCMDFGVRASFGENASEIEDENRTTRKSTPNDLMMNPKTLRSTDSTTNTIPDYSSVSINPGSQGLSRGLLPTKRAIDEFFARAEEELHKEFIKKYNFDPVNEKPLPGRYQWERVNH